MKSCRLVLLGLTCCLVSAFVCTAVAQEEVKEDIAEQVVATDLRHAMLGAWVLVGDPDSVEAPKPGARMKFWGLNKWAITQSDPKTGEIIFHHGGSYTLDGDSYEETFEFANDNTKHLIGTKLKFKIKVGSDAYVQIGDGNPYSERWIRLK